MDPSYSRMTMISFNFNHIPKEKEHIWIGLTRDLVRTTRCALHLAEFPSSCGTPPCALLPLCSYPHTAVTPREVIHSPRETQEQQLLLGCHFR